MRIAYHFCSTLVAFSAFFLAGCALVEEPAYKEPEAEVVPEPEHESELVLHLSIAGDSQHASRAESRPLGGENGDGRELGQHHENDIENLTIFHYKRTNNDYNDGFLNTPVKKVAYIENVNFRPIEPNADGQTVYTTEVPIAISQFEAADYRFSNQDKYIVVANMGDFPESNSAFLRVGNVYNYLVKQAWTVAETLGDYHHFVMSNEKESVYKEGGKGTKQEPYEYSVDIERVAARFDFCIDGSSTAYYTNPATSRVENVLNYTVRDAGQDVGHLLLTHVRPFNVMQEPTYLLKRLGGKDNNDLKYLLDEVAYKNSVLKDENSFPFYVVEPHTWQKNNVSAADLNKWYNSSRYAYINEDWFTEAYRVHHKSNAEGVDGFNTGTTYIGDGLCNDIFVLGYGNENTMLPSATTHDVATGYMLRGIYVPNKVYTEVDAVGQAVNASINFAPGTTFYRYRPMVTAYDETKSVYFASSECAEQYKEAHPEMPAAIETYEKGICYYPVYMRHDHSGEDMGIPYITPMEFGIVRNNIYRLKVSFTGPGYNTVPDTPEEPLGIKPYIYARKWYQINHPEIPI